MKTTLTTLQRFLGTTFLLVAVSALLIGCTRDRPIEGTVATPGASTEVVAPPTSTPVPQTQGEPMVVEATPSPDEEAAAANADGTPVATEDEYIVQPGDTLLSIAIEFGMSVDDLKTLNFMQNDLLSAGQPLRVLRVPPTPEPTPEPFTHVVAAGDSLGGIAQRYGISQVDLINANRIADPNALRVGDALIIPNYAPPAAEGSAEGETAGTTTDASGVVLHTVQPGESLTQIAQDYGVLPSAISNANGLSNPNNLRVGTTLTIPGVTAADVAERNAVWHTVQSGETLSEIAQQYGTSSIEIVALNGLANANAIRVGQVLMIPQ